MAVKVLANPGSRWLIIGGWLSIIAALLHLACMIGGPDWFRFFGAGEEMAEAVEQGRLMPYLLTTGIAVGLGIWAAYAFSGAGKIMRLPLLRMGLVIISSIYLLRGLLIVPIAMKIPYAKAPFDYWSSLIVLVYGIVYTVGTVKAWKSLKPV